VFRVTKNQVRMRKASGGIARRSPHGEMICIEAEAGSTNQGKQEADNGNDEPRPLLPSSAGIERKLQVLACRLRGECGAKSALSPGGKGGIWDLDLPGHGFSAATKDMFTQAMIANVVLLG
jgi:hypothetical protein